MRYRSNLTAPDLEPFFSHTYSRSYGCGHDVLSDTVFQPDCGYITHDEAAVLYHIALQFPGRWLEIGTHTGWSAAHIALAGNLVVGTDPSLGDVRFFLRAHENLTAAGVADRVRLYAGMGEGYLAEEKSQMFSGAFIDGNHDSPAPLNDAKAVLPHLLPAAVVTFHDFAGRAVRDGVSYLKSQGFNFRVYNTPQFLGVCWRGAPLVLKHVPDPAVDWIALRRNMPDFDFRGEQ